MKILLPSPCRRRDGAALILAVLFLVFVAIFLASYLFLTQGEYVTVARSQKWNASLVLAEAGVEDALAFVNQNVGQVGTVTNWSIKATSDGWSQISSNASVQVFYLDHRSPDTNLGYYSVYVTNFITGSSNGPSILSIGTAYWNDTGGVKGGDSQAVAAFRDNPVRKIFIRTAATSQLGGGLIAYAGMNFNGNNVTIDSFDSTTNTHSIWQTVWRYHGQYYGYWDSSLSYVSNSFPSRTANVTVATDGSIINVGNANIAGNVDTAPGGTVSINKNGYVGDLAWVYTSSGSSPGNATTHIEPGHQQDDMNKTFFSKALPSPVTASQSTWWPVPAVSTNIAGVSYSYMITNLPANSNLVYYSMNNLGSSIFIDASNVVLYLVNGLSYSSGDTFTVNNGADVQLWSTGDIKTQGNAAINNSTKNAHALSIYDVSGYPINITFAGNGVGTGYIYAPGASLQFNGGGGGSTYDVVGAIFCHDIQINGHYNFHFDESLSQTTGTDQFIPVVWQEVF